MAKADVGPKIDETNRKLDKLTKAVERIGGEVGREINGAARNGRRLARV